MICDIIHLETASSLANYTSNFYAETPVVTKNNFGQGTVYYVGTQLENHALNKVLEMVTTEKQIQSVINEPTDLEITCRYKENHAYYFIINFKNQLLSLPQRFIGKKDLLTGKLLENDEKMAAYTTYLIKE